MVEETEKEEEEAGENTAPSSKKTLYFAIGGLVLFLLIVLVGLFLVLGGEDNKPLANGSPSSSSSVEEIDDAFYVDDPDSVLTGAIISLEPFVVNLEAEDTFLQVRLDLEFFDFTPPENIDRKLPQIRDIVIEVLSSRKVGQVLTVSGKEKLRVKLLYEINQLFDEKDAQVVDIYFLDFLVQ